MYPHEDELAFKVPFNERVCQVRVVMVARREGVRIGAREKEHLFMTMRRRCCRHRDACASFASSGAAAARSHVHSLNRGTQGSGAIDMDHETWPYHHSCMRRYRDAEAVYGETLLLSPERTPAKC